jgi:Putative prokaryotic signal transducing protein
MMDEFVTVFRSADESAEEDAKAVADVLNAAGISAVIADDDARGVVEGVIEVRVAALDAARAEQEIAARHVPEDEFADPDESHELDYVTVFNTGDGTSESESEALTVKSLLEANGVFAIVSGENVPIPSLGWEIRVAKEHEAEARRIISEARAAGPSGAEEAESETER